MRQIVIGDIHWRDTWNHIVLYEWFFDEVIFLGDYFDSREGITPEQQQDNFRNILQFKRNNTDRVKLLFGNHDYHYLPSVSEHYSWFNGVQKYTVWEMLKDAISKDEVQLFYISNGVYFSHAGVSKHFLMENRLELRGPEMEKWLNDLLKFYPGKLWFNSRDVSSIWDHVSQSPIWIRPNALVSSPPLLSTIQVVWHTQVKHITFRLESPIHTLIQVDALWSGEYLIIEDGKFSVGNIYNVK